MIYVPSKLDPASVAISAELLRHLRREACDIDQTTNKSTTAIAEARVLIALADQILKRELPGGWAA